MSSELFWSLVLLCVVLYLLSMLGGLLIAFGLLIVAWLVNCYRKFKWRGQEHVETKD